MFVWICTQCGAPLNIDSNRCDYCKTYVSASPSSESITKKDLIHAEAVAKSTYKALNTLWDSSSISISPSKSISPSASISPSISPSEIYTGPSAEVTIYKHNSKDTILKKLRRLFW